MSEQSGSEGSVRSPLDLLMSYYHIPVLAAIIGLMLAIRLRAYNRFVREDGTVLFASNDPWYHYRETIYVVDNWPYTMPYDPWTGFPEGNLAGQFGTLWDQMVATVILVVGLGDPSTELAAQVMLVATPVMAALCVIPTYLLARRFLGKPFALLSVFLLALIPGQFLTRSLVGSYQHHAAETFFMTFAVVTFLYALSIATRQQPIWELVVDRDFDALREPVAWSALAGFVTALYMYVWQPGVLLVGIVGVFFALRMTSDVYHRRTPEPIAFVAAVSMTVTGLLMIVPLETFEFGVTDYSYTQIFLPLAVAAGAVFLAFLARQWEHRDLDIRAYPATVVGLIALSMAFLMVVLPDVWSTIWGNVERTLAFSATDTTRTIAEAQAMLSEGRGRVFAEYGLTFIAGMVGAIVLFAAPLVNSDESGDTIYAIGALAAIPLMYLLAPALSFIAGLVGLEWQVLALLLGAAGLFGATFRVRYDVETLFLLVWTGFLICAAFTQIRFNYYLVIPVVILTALVVERTITALDVEAGANLSMDDIAGWQVVLIAALLLALVVPVLAVPIEVDNQQTANAFQTGQNHGPGEIQLWEDSIQWMSEGTPYPGEYGGHDNRMEHYGTYDRPPGDDFEYDDGAYGVLAWWDYGHWITTRSERIPVANPFQQNAGTAANFLVAPNEEMANEHVSDEEAEGVRYVVLDHSVADVQGPKYNAPTVYYNDEEIDHDDLNRPVYAVGERGQLQRAALLTSQRGHESMRNRLFAYHGSAQDPEPVVVRYDEETITLPNGEELDVLLLPQDDREFVEEYDTMEEAEQAVEDDPNAQIGGIQGLPSERVDALEQYRLVHSSVIPAQFNPQIGEPHVKTFERVEGATIEGSGAPADTEIEATVQMEIGATGQTFEYTQYADTDENGEFEMTVPYATTGYEEYGVDAGYTDVDVQAVGPYQFATTPEMDEETLRTYAYTDTEHVTEGQVIGEDDSTVTVELERETLDAPEGADPDDDETDNDADNDSEDEEQQRVSADPHA